MRHTPPCPANKVRSGLTILGIVIGIGSVIAMISIGQGAQGSIQSSIQSIGSNLIMVMPGAQKSPGYAVLAGRGSARTLTNEDAAAVLAGVSMSQLLLPSFPAAIRSRPKAPTRTRR